MPPPGLPQMGPSGSSNTTLVSNRLTTALLPGSDSTANPHNLWKKLKDSLVFPWGGCGWLSCFLSRLVPMKHRHPGLKRNVQLTFREPLPVQG